MSQYHYTECGLDNVIVEDLPVATDDDGDEVITIPNINLLHRAIALAIVAQEAGIDGKELRFLRTEMGKTQAELAAIVHRDAQTIGRWERGEIPIDPNAEALIRLQAKEQLGLSLDATVAELSARCIPAERKQAILIDGSNPREYRPVAA